MRQRKLVAVGHTVRGTDGHVIDETKPRRRVLPAMMSRGPDRHKSAFARIIRSVGTWFRSTRGRDARVNCFAHGSDGALNCIDRTRADYHHNRHARVPCEARKEDRDTDQ